LFRHRCPPTPNQEYSSIERSFAAMFSLYPRAITSHKRRSSPGRTSGALLVRRDFTTALPSEGQFPVKHASHHLEPMCSLRVASCCVASKLTYHARCSHVKSATPKAGTGKHRRIHVPIDLLTRGTAFPQAYRSSAQTARVGFARCTDNDSATPRI
jgi:hypothetical protein